MNRQADVVVFRGFVWVVRAVWAALALRDVQVVQVVRVL